MSVRQKPNESGERKEERDGGNLSKTGQHCRTNSVYMSKKKKTGSFP